jgi:uncharacterized protein YdeI (YjbR/CyaY-like superfamily)
MNVLFFKTPAEWRAWLEMNHDSANEVLVGFYRKGSGKPSITWPQAVDEALCFGWIDNVRRRLDDESYSNRFTPRRPRSTWSLINIKRFEELDRLGRIQPAGRQAFEARDPERSGRYSYEGAREVDPDYEQRFKENAGAWQFFASRPPWYRRAAWHWIADAKRDATRIRRLEKLIDYSQRELTVPALTPGRRSTTPG